MNFFLFFIKVVRGNLKIMPAVYVRRIGDTVAKTYGRACVGRGREEGGGGACVGTCVYICVCVSVCVLVRVVF